MAGTEMDMVGVSTLPHSLLFSLPLHFSLTLYSLQNVLPQIFDEGATEDKGEMARMVSTYN